MEGGRQCGKNVMYKNTMKSREGGGVLALYMTWGFGVASYCNPPKMHEPEKKYLASKFLIQNKINTEINKSIYSV